jgi:hypothetical protein
MLIFGRKGVGKGDRIVSLTISPLDYPYIQHPLWGTLIIYLIHLFQIIRLDPGRISFNFIPTFFGNRSPRAGKSEDIAPITRSEMCCILDSCPLRF